MKITKGIENGRRGRNNSKWQGLAQNEIKTLRHWWKLKTEGKKMGSGKNY